MGRIRRISLGALLATLLLAAPAQARDAIVESFDGTPIVTHFFPAPGLSEGERAPTIMLGHGWGGSGATSAPEHYASAGYNVLTWDARGFGGSGGTVMIDHPEFEGRDAQALIDFIAEQPEAQLDGAGDPRVGMDGPSYGGGVQLITAARDDRLDAIAPTIAWSSLVSSLYKADSVKAGWGLALAGLGVPTSTLPGVFSPAGVQTGHQSPQFYSLVINGLGSGRFLAEDVAWLDEHGPDHLLSQIEAPTLISQGTVDTLFTLEEAHRNFAALKAAGVPAKMIWFCGGHGACLTGSDSGDPLSGISGDGGRVQERKLAWFARYLHGDASAEVGPEFEWVDEEGDWHESASYPLRRVGSVSGQGSGNIVLAPGESGSGVLIFATEALAGGLTVPIEVPPAGADVVGEPTLKLTYTATGTSTAPDGDTHLYAQLIDRSRQSPLLPGTDLVVNNLATPIKIELDGQSHQIELPLERIASRAGGAGYELQLIPQTNVYDLQRALGLVQVQSAEVTLPLSAPVTGQAAPAPGAPAPVGAGGAPAPGQPAAGATKRAKKRAGRKCKRAKKRAGAKKRADAKKRRKGAAKKRCKPKGKKKKKKRR
jgi:ABC-2 type transport system ATP-binding protein